MIREDYELDVIRISHAHPCYQSWRGMRSFNDALDVFIEIGSRYPFDDVMIVEKHWSTDLQCYVGIKV